MLVVVVAALAGCGDDAVPGPQGPQGPEGPAGPAGTYAPGDGIEINAGTISVQFSATGGGTETTAARGDHLHDARYYTRTDADTLLAGKSDVGHDHGGLYYTETETDALLVGKSDTGHNHDTRYYTQSEANTLLAGKSSVSHDHDTRYCTRSELSKPGTINDSGNPVDWTRLKGVPGGLADGFDSDTTYSSGPGLILESTTFYADFEGSGTADKVARSDHHHSDLVMPVGPPTPVVLVDGAGRVGVNEPSPEAQLEVNGDCKVTGEVIPAGGLVRTASGITIESTTQNVVVVAGASRITVAQDGTITIESNADINLNAANGALNVNAKSVNIASDSTVAISAQTTMDITSQSSMSLTSNHNLSATAAQTALLRGMNTDVEGSTTVDVKVGSSAVKIDPAKIDADAPMITLN